MGQTIQLFHSANATAHNPEQHMAESSGLNLSPLPHSANKSRPSKAHELRPRPDASRISTSTTYDPEEGPAGPLE